MHIAPAASQEHQLKEPLIDMASAQIISAALSLSLAPLVSDGLAALQRATDLK
jgi:hypothetical protein